MGWDLFTPEIVCGSAPYTRDVIAKVLASKVDAGLYAMSLALDIAHDIMHRTAEALYGEPSTVSL